MQLSLPSHIDERTVATVSIAQHFHLIVSHMATASALLLPPAVIQTHHSAFDMGGHVSNRPMLTAVIEHHDPLSGLNLSLTGIFRMDHHIRAVTLNLQDPLIHPVTGVYAARQFALTAISG